MQRVVERGSAESPRRYGNGFVAQSWFRDSRRNGVAIKGAIGPGPEVRKSTHVETVRNQYGTIGAEIILAAERGRLCPKPIVLLR